MRRFLILAAALVVTACETAPSRMVVERLYGGASGAGGGSGGGTLLGGAGESASDIRRRDMILETQQWLNRFGYNAGPEDGLMGPRTERAIKAWQADHALLPDGEADLDLLERLRASGGARE